MFVNLCFQVCGCSVRPGALSDGDSEFFQHADSFLLVLLPGQPEVVLVLHDVGQHRSTQEHHVLSPGRILNPDLKFLHDKGNAEGVIISLQHNSAFSSEGPGGFSDPRGEGGRDQRPDRPLSWMEIRFCSWDQDLCPRNETLP